MKKGALGLACRLRDAGVEVIYSGCLFSPEQIVVSAIQEDVDLVGLSVSEKMPAFRHMVAELLKEHGADDIPAIEAEFCRTFA